MTVFSNVRDVDVPPMVVPDGLSLNVRHKMEGRVMLGLLEDKCVPVAFFDPQFRGVYDRLKYGNEETSRNYERVMIPQMTEDDITCFVKEIARVLIPSGHLFLWVDKFHLCQDFRVWLKVGSLNVVDMITWDKGRIGLGYRSRHRSEFCVVVQKTPKRAKGHWIRRDIPDVWKESVKRSHAHTKPIGLQQALIEAVSNKGDVVLDPAAGGYSVLEACKAAERNFLGCDING